MLFCPVVKALEQDDRFSSVVVSTGQHAEMLQQVLAVFKITPDYDLKIMRPGQTLTDHYNPMLMISHFEIAGTCLGGSKI